MSQSLMILLYFRVFTYLELVSNPYSEAKLEIYIFDVNLDVFFEARSVNWPSMLL